MLSRAGPQTVEAMMSRLLLFALLSLGALLAGCQPDAPDETFEFETMDTVASGTIEMWDRTLRRSPSEMVHAVFDSVAARLVRETGNSKVGRLNSLPVDTLIEISPWLSECLRVSELLYQVGDGAFAPTTGSADDPARRGRYKHDPFRRTLIKLDADIHFDLGGIARGFAVDRAVRNLREMGISSAKIDLGGTLFCLGRIGNRDPWPVDIRDPRDRNRTIATFTTVNRAVSTSVASSDPMPEMLGVTVICRNAILAAGLGETLLGLGPDRAIALLNTHYPNLNAVLIVPGGENKKARLLATSGLRNNLHILPDGHGDYSLEYPKKLQY